MKSSMTFLYHPLPWYFIALQLFIPAQCLREPSSDFWVQSYNLFPKAPFLLPFPPSDLVHPLVPEDIRLFLIVGSVFRYLVIPRGLLASSLSPNCYPSFNTELNFFHLFPPRLSCTFHYLSSSTHSLCSFIIPHMFVAAMCMQSPVLTEMKDMEGSSP